MIFQLHRKLSFKRLFYFEEQKKQLFFLHLKKTDVIFFFLKNLMQLQKNVLFLNFFVIIIVYNFLTLNIFQYIFVYFIDMLCIF